MDMFCFQCEQTANGTACTVQGVCGKSPEVSTLQDLLVYAVKGMAMYAHRAAKLGLRDHQIDVFVIEALFSTVTNVNFDPQRLQKLLLRATELRDKVRSVYQQACKKAHRPAEQFPGPAAWQPAKDLEGLIRQGQEITIRNRIDSL